MMNVAIIGIGLIGGSMAIDLKKSKAVKKIIGIDSNPEHLRMALNLGLIHESKSFEEAIQQSDAIILATPVNVSKVLLPKILSIVDRQLVMDVGSTKLEIINCAENSQNRKRFVATHPMAGTENSGPEAAQENLFRNKTVIFCDSGNSDDSAVQKAKEIYEILGMNRIEMDGKSHDLHAAYVSHISHISSFALALTVLEKEKSESNILAMAGGGFDSTVRLAKSSSQMWTPILMENANNIVSVLNSYINVLQQFKDAMMAQDATTISNLILNSNEIKKVLSQFKSKVEFANLL